MELLEYIREADGGAVRREMAMMQKEMSANTRQRETAVERLEQEQHRFKNIKARFDALADNVGEEREKAGGARVGLDQELSASMRQRRLMHKESRAREVSQNSAESARARLLGAHAEVEEWRGKYYTRDKDAFDAETTIASLQDRLADMQMAQDKLRGEYDEKEAEAEKQAKQIQLMGELRKDLDAEIRRLKESLSKTRDAMAANVAATEKAERELTMKVEECTALTARVSALAISDAEQQAEIRDLRTRLACIYS